MTAEHERELVGLAEKVIRNDDPSHDLLHALRILGLAKKIAAAEGGDLDVVVPAALFHDAVMYPKDDPRAGQAAAESAKLVAGLLAGLSWYPREKIAAAAQAVARCSFSKNLPKETIEEHILQDADLLESLGALAVARTFSSSGQMKRAFYHRADPAATGRTAEPYRYALDLFAARLFQAEGRLHTAAAKAIGAGRAGFLRAFYEEFLAEIAGE